MVSNSKHYKPEIFIFLVFLCLINFSESQSYSGVIQVSDSIMFPYYLKLPTKLLPVYSVSDMHGPTETLSLISIKDDGNGLLNVEESFVIYTRTKSGEYDDFCKVFFDLKTQELSSKSMEFNFEARLNTGLKCATGIINVEETTSLTKKLEKFKDKISKNKIIKSLINKSKREVSITKIIDLQKFSPYNFIEAIPLKLEDSINFLCLSEKTSVRLTFDMPIETLETYLNIVTQSRITKLSNSILVERRDPKETINIELTATDSASPIRFKMDTSKNLELQFSLDLNPTERVFLSF